MLRKLIQTLKRLFKKIKKLSIWFRLTMIFLVILITFVAANKYHPQREAFTQERKFTMKKGMNVYDDFYADIYNDLLHDSIKNNYEIHKKTVRLSQR